MTSEMIRNELKSLLPDKAAAERKSSAAPAVGLFGWKAGTERPDTPDSKADNPTDHNRAA